jgi:hypothetical protein
MEFIINYILFGSLAYHTLALEIVALVAVDLCLRAFDAQVQSLCLWPKLALI